MSRRHLLDYFALASLLLAAMTTAGWLRSHHRQDMVGWKSRTGASGSRVEATALTATEGLLGIMRMEGPDEVFADLPHGRPFHVAVEPEVPEAGDGAGSAAGRLRRGAGERAGFIHTSGGVSFLRTHFDLWLVPFWFVLLPTLLPPLAWLLSTARRRRRSSRGLCPDCGYDLRATPGRCPECGAGGDGAVRAPPVFARAVRTMLCGVLTFLVLLVTLAAALAVLHYA